MDKTLLKGLRVLEAVVTSGGPIGVTELAARVGLLKSNAHRILQTLVEAGYVAPGPAGGQYQPTLKLWTLGSAVAAGTDLRQVAGPHVKRLREATGETAYLALREGLQAVFIEIQPSFRAIRLHTTIGTRMPAHCTSAGKVFLAFDDPRHGWMEEPSLQRFTQTTIVEQAALRAELKAIKRQGYAVNRGEYREEVSGIAVPVFGANGAVIAATGISGPSERFRPAAVKAWLPEVRTAGAEISLLMGYQGSREL